MKNHWLSNSVPIWDFQTSLGDTIKMSDEGFKTLKQDLTLVQEGV